MTSRTQGAVTGLGGLADEPISTDPAHRHRTGRQDELFPAQHPDPAKDGAALASCVHQGGAHNCMLLAALAALAHGQPDLVRAMIRENPDGSLGVRFFSQEGAPDVPSDPLWIDVSRKILRDAAGSPVFARTPDADQDGRAELWVAVVEKAYTVYIDRHLRAPDDVAPAYTLLDGIHPTQCLKALTGWTYHCLTTGYDHGDPEAVRASLQPLHDGVAVQASCGRPSIPGLIPAHAYSVLGMFTRDDGTTMVRLRNPWGTQPAEDRPDPTPEADAGCFALTFQEFMATFWDYYVPVLHHPRCADPGFPDAAQRVTAEGAAGELHRLCTTPEGGLLHAMRYADGTWSSPGNVATVVNLPGPMVALAAAGGLPGEVHVALVTEDGRLWHTIRYADGAWSPLGNVGAQVALEAAVTAVDAASGIQGDVHCVFATREKHFFHTTRNADGTWTGLQPVTDLAEARNAAAQRVRQERR